MHVTQKPFNTVTLRLIGDDAAPTFFEVTPSKQVKVKAGVHLTSDTETEYMVRSQCKLRSYILSNLLMTDVGNINLM